MPLRTFKLKRGDRHVSKAKTFVGPMPEGMKVYEVEPPADHGIVLLAPHTAVKVDADRPEDADVFFFPDEDLEEVA